MTGERHGRSIRLPVSGASAWLRRPTGRDEVMLAESDGEKTELALELLERICSETAWRKLTPTDFDNALLQLRIWILGDAVRAEAACESAACGSTVDIEFSLTAYLDHHKPSKPRGVRPGKDSGWHEIAGCGAFRLPTMDDLLAVSGKSDPGRSLSERCLSNVTGRRSARIERAMEAMAPSLAGELDGVCAECGRGLSVLFDPRQYVLTELRDQAQFIYDEVSLLAAAYHWPESEILDMPAFRRNRYAEILRRRKLYD